MGRWRNRDGEGAPTPGSSPRRNCRVSAPEQRPLRPGDGPQTLIHHRDAGCGSRVTGGRTDDGLTWLSGGPVHLAERLQRGQLEQGFHRYGCSVGVEEPIQWRHPRRTGPKDLGTHGSARADHLGRNRRGQRVPPATGRRGGPGTPGHGRHAQAHDRPFTALLGRSAPLAQGRLDALQGPNPAPR